MATGIVRVSNQHIRAKVFSDVSESLSIGNSSLTSCRFPQVTAPRFAIHASRLADCEFTDAQIAAPTLSNVSFVGCHFSGVFWNWISRKASFVACVFEGEIRNSVFELPPEEFGRFEHNDFSRSVFNGVSFRGGIDVGSQTLPDQNRDFVVVNTSEVAVRRAIELLQSQDDDRSMRGWLRVILRNVRGGQRSVLVDKGVLSDEILQILADRPSSL